MLVVHHSPVMITLTFPGGGAPVPDFSRWRLMTHQWCRSMKLYDLMTWAYAVPHTRSRRGRNGDIHLLCDLHQPIVDAILATGGSTQEGILHNRRSKKVGPQSKSLEYVAVASGFGHRVDLREVDDGASAYLLGSHWDPRQGPWRSGTWTKTLPRDSDPLDEMSA